MKVSNTTPFQERVYAVVRNIPKGQTMSYGEVARILKSSPRAVGQALKRNPYAPIVPCHRVIHADGRIGGYSGIKDSQKKIRLLKDEGVRIEDGKSIRWI